MALALAAAKVAPLPFILPFSTTSIIPSVLKIISVSRVSVVVAPLSENTVYCLEYEKLKLIKSTFWLIKEDP